MDKYKKLASNTLIFSIGSFSSKILSFLLVRLYTSYMVQDMVSTVGIMQIIVNLLEPLASLSMAEAIVRYGVEKSIRKDTLFSSACLVSLTGIIASLIFFPIIALFSDYRPYISLMFILLFTSAFRWITQQQVKVKNYTKLYAADGILSVATLTAFNIILIVVMETGITGYLLSLIFSDICSLIFLYVFANLKADLNFKAVDKRLAREMIRYSLPLIPTKILWWVVGSSDTFMVKGFVGKSENAQYLIAYKIPNLISSLSNMFFFAWQMSALSEYNSKERRAFYTKIFDAYAAILFVASAGVMLVLNPVTSLIARGEAYGDTYRMSAFLIISVFFMSLCMFLSTIYNASNTNRKSLTSSMWAAGINVVGNLILIPVFHAQGAAFSTMLAYLVCFMIRIVDTRKIVNFSVSWRRLVAGTIVITAMAVVVIAQAPLGYMWLSIGFVAMVLINLDPIDQTVRKVIRR